MRQLLSWLCVGTALAAATIANAQPEGPPLGTPPPSAVPPMACDVNTCRHLGVCANANGQCGVALGSCRQSLRCAALGFCTPLNGQCGIGANEDCKQSAACRSHGLCAARGQSCVAEEPLHCLESRVCIEQGACSPRGGICVRDRQAEDVGGVTKPRSLGLRATGIAFTIAGPLLGAVGTSLLFTDDDGAIVAGAFMAPVGGTLLLMGIPMWAIGQQEIPGHTQPQSMGALTTGIVLSALGLGGIGVGGVFFGAAETDNTLPAIPMVIGGSMLIGGLAAGIYGIATTPISQAATLRVGPGSFDLTLGF